MTRTNRTWGWAAPDWPAPAIGAWVRSERIALSVLLLALVQGLVYLALVPPWQHYDEPTHFEYAWLIANRRRLPVLNEMDQQMRREVAASMLAHNFYHNLPQPDLLTDERVIEIGISELVHPPAYYLLVSLPLRAARYLDVTTQLYVARLVSVGLFVLTIAIALGLMRDLVPRGHVLRWAVPLFLVLLPPFVDIMTAVNNDVGAVVVFSLFLWLGVRTIRYGVAWRRALLLCGSAALAVATKNTASVAVVLVPVVLVLAVWVQHAWPWRYLGFATLGAGVVLVLTTLSWGDAAAWYRGTVGVGQAETTRAKLRSAPVGQYVLQVDVPANTQNTVLNPMLETDIAHLAGQEVTAGAWVWATQPISSATLSLDYGTYHQPVQSLTAVPLSITTTPTFVAWTTTVPTNTLRLQYRLSVLPTGGSQAGQVFLDGAVLVPGRFPATDPPSFDDDAARRGTWAGSEFSNVVRNGSAEQAWPRLNPWVDRLLVKYARRSPTLVLASLFDLERTGRTLLYDVPALVLFSFFGVFAWGQVHLERTAWLPIFQLVVATAGLGCGRWVWETYRRSHATLVPALTFVAIAGLVIWGNVVLRVLPLLEGRTVFAAPRYGFPAAIAAALVLAGGWHTVWPPRLRFHGMLVLLAAVAALNIVALWTISSFHRSVPM